jgi:predicted nucleic acid-binding Zn ribbon protein
MKNLSENNGGNNANTVLAPVFNYRCKKCGSTYTDLKKPLNYSNCVVEKPITHEKCNGQLVSF